VTRWRVLGVVQPRDEAESPELLIDGHAAGDIDGLAANAARLRQALRVEIADDHAGGAEKLRAGRCSKADGTGASDVHSGTCDIVSIEICFDCTMYRVTSPAVTPA
jgi:hypothetical protein